MENNHLSQPQQQSRSEELVACNGNATCRAEVREKYAAEYDKLQNEIANCSSPEQCVALAKELKGWQGDYSARMTELENKERNEGISALTEAEVQEWANLRGAMSNIDASRNLLMNRAQSLGGSEDTSAEVANIMGHAGIASAAGIAGGVSKAGSSGKGQSGTGSAIPVPESVMASNGLKYKSNPKHTPGGDGNRPNAGIEPKDSLDLFAQSIPSSKQYPNKEVRVSVDGQGNVHRFEGTNGEYHWNGSSGDEKNKLTGKQIPSDIQKQLGVRIK
ncbi:hemolysin/hemagglutinin-like protein HecA precursor [Dickeya ananatis]|uniref:hemolysin/hemagglutinin-like protein HecA precursor n=1 Tax=Dickeya ananatis TaxID=3061286 RepID=UPI00388EEB7D